MPTFPRLHGSYGMSGGRFFVWHDALHVAKLYPFPNKGMFFSFYHVFHGSKQHCMLDSDTLTHLSWCQDKGTHPHPHTHTHMCIQMHVHICTHTYVHVHIHLSAHMHIHMHTLVHIYTHMHIHIRRYTCIHIHAHTTHEHTLVHKYMHTHMHAPKYTRDWIKSLLCNNVGRIVVSWPIPCEWTRSMETVWKPIIYKHECLFHHHHT